MIFKKNSSNKLRFDANKSHEADLIDWSVSGYKTELMGLKRFHLVFKSATNPDMSKKLKLKCYYSQAWNNSQISL